MIFERYFRIIWRLHKFK